jgi:pre-mRNA-splicing helicase BRR2
MKKPVYWAVAIMTKLKHFLAMALVTVARTLAVRLEFTLPKEGQYELDLWVDCDSYMGLGRTIRLDEIVVRS